MKDKAIALVWDGRIIALPLFAVVGPLCYAARPLYENNQR
jgi:hypothetical protein